MGKSIISLLFLAFVTNRAGCEGQKFPGSVVSKVLSVPKQQKRLLPDPRLRSMYAQLTENDIIKNPQERLYRARFLPMNTWARGIVPVIIDKQIVENRLKIEAILAAMKVFAQYTCIRFQTRKTEKDYLKIIDGGIGRCYSFVGRIGGEQILSIGDGCEAQVGVIVHEMNHALGILHEHSRPDRDNYITVKYDAIKKGYWRNFEKYGPQVADTMGLPYDYASIMHYHAYAFSKNGKMTIIPKDFDQMIPKTTRTSSSSTSSTSTTTASTTTSTTTSTTASTHSPTIAHPGSNVRSFLMVYVNGACCAAI